MTFLRLFFFFPFREPIFVPVSYLFSPFRRVKQFGAHWGQYLLLTRPPPQFPPGQCQLMRSWATQLSSGWTMASWDTNIFAVKEGCLNQKGDVQALKQARRDGIWGFRISCGEGGLSSPLCIVAQCEGRHSLIPCQAASHLHFSLLEYIWLY